LGIEGIAKIAEIAKDCQKWKAGLIASQKAKIAPEQCSSRFPAVRRKCGAASGWHLGMFKACKILKSVEVY
jgi:hypothetical protein